MASIEFKPDTLTIESDGQITEILYSSLELEINYDLEVIEVSGFDASFKEEVVYLYGKVDYDGIEQYAGMVDPSAPVGVSSEFNQLSVALKAYLYLGVDSDVAVDHVHDIESVIGLQEELLKKADVSALDSAISNVNTKTQSLQADIDVVKADLSNYLAKGVSLDEIAQGTVNKFLTEEQLTYLVNVIANPPSTGGSGTADITAQQVRTLLLQNADTNVLTDAQLELVKSLNNVEELTGKTVSDLLDAYFGSDAWRTANGSDYVFNSVKELSYVGMYETVEDLNLAFPNPEPRLWAIVKSHVFQSSNTGTWTIPYVDTEIAGSTKQVLQESGNWDNRTFIGDYSQITQDTVAGKEHFDGTYLYKCVINPSNLSEAIWIRL